MYYIIYFILFYSVYQMSPVLFRQEIYEDILKNKMNIYVMNGGW